MSIGLLSSPAPSPAILYSITVRALTGEAL